MVWWDIRRAGRLCRLLFTDRLEKPIDEIAIAWKYSHRAPGYNVYASNNDEVMGNTPSKTAGWSLVATRNARWLDSPQAWDRVGISLYNWRYIKIEMTETGGGWGSAIFELRLYGPAR